MNAKIISCVLLLAAAIATAAIPPDETHAKGTLEKSPRHGEWIDVKVDGAKAPVKCYVVYPERKSDAGVVIVIHEIFGMSDWVRGVADQLAADGFIAIAPDLLSGMGKDGGGTDSYASRDDVVKAIRDLKPETVMKDLDAVRDAALKLPANNHTVATIGCCWGGGMSFAYAAHQPDLNAAVVYYGTPPSNDALKSVAAPVMGFYGGDDARVTSTVKPTEEAMKSMKKEYTAHVFEGAGHGFLRQQDGKNGANQKAADQAWPATIEFLKRVTRS